MTTPTNVHYEGAVYHVGARGVRRTALFLDDQDRRVFLALIEALKARYGFAVLCLCLMTNHFHLLLQVAKVPLAKIMHGVMSAYARYFNRRYCLEGHVFDDRYFRKLVRSDRYLETVIRYILSNPVEAGIVDSSVDWPWSSAREFAKGKSDGLLDLDRVIDLLDGQLPSELALPEFSVPDEAYVVQEEAPSFDEPIAPPDLELIAAEILAGSGFRIEHLRGRSKQRSVVECRRKFYREAIASGASGKAAAAFLGQSATRASEAFALNR